MTPPALLSAALLLLLLPATLTDDGLVPFSVVVQNRLLGATPRAYITHVKYRGILLGGLKRLMNSTNTFRFTYTENQDYGPYLESVNGLARNDDDRTYWELLVKMTNGRIVRTEAGIGCYIPSENEQVILNFTRWEDPSAESGISNVVDDHDGAFSTELGPRPHRGQHQS
uniref:DUF4430 domain-containing protein n=1 Tax=Salarias fasciatus TaxID=181472 RepID=A0A672IGD2_SALFA